MVLLHNTLIPFRTKSLHKNEKKKRASMNYREARTVGIVFAMTNLDDFETVRKFETRLRKEGKEVQVLSYLPASVENFDFHYDFFNQKDFSLFGGLKSGNILKFLEKQFDILICLDRNINIYMEYIMAASAARFRIGPYISKRENIFELMIRTAEGSELSELINQIYHYTNEL